MICMLSRITSLISGNWFPLPEISMSW
jgi:hypothetical protein